MVKDRDSKVANAVVTGVLTVNEDLITFFILI